MPDEETHKNPSHDRRLEFGLKINGVDFGTARVVTLYASTAGNSGTGRYFANGTGKEDTGKLVLTKASIVEGAAGDAAVQHTVSLSGKIIKPNGMVEPEGTPYALPASGTWQFQVGNYRSVAVDLAAAVAAKRLKETKTHLQFKPAAGGDVKLFKLEKRKGEFQLQFNAISADPGVGLPAAKSEDLSVVADLYVAFELDFDSGPVDMGGFVRVERANARLNAWKKQ